MITMELWLDYVPDGEGAGWWCHLDPADTGAIAKGETPWLAIAAAFEAMPEAVARNQRLDAFLGELMAGRVACGACGKPIEPPEPDGMCSISRCAECARPPARIGGG